MLPNIQVNKILLSILLFSAPLYVSAQAINVIGNSTNARECYEAAQIAVQLQSASRNDVEKCTYSLENEPLRLRDRAATYANRGILFVANEEYEKAVKDYKRAKNMYPEFGAIHVNIGNLFFMSDSYDRAIDEYTKALGLNTSSSHVAHLNRGMAYEKLGKYNEAETDYRTALEIFPEWSIATSKLERVLGKMKKKSSSIQQNG